ncbi:hypothetical protein FQN55_003697 [Onygenales sp. PD_40]|nr:hypothetical protein FQN55_003697 [Onygenales sp. PD_40]
MHMQPNKDSDKTITYLYGAVKTSYISILNTSPSSFNPVTIYNSTQPTESDLSPIGNSHRPRRMLHLRYYPVTAARITRFLPTTHSKLSHAPCFLSPLQTASMVSLSEPQRAQRSPRASTRILLELPKDPSVADTDRKFESSCIYRATDDKYTRSFYAVVKCVPAPPTPSKKACLGDGSSTIPDAKRGTAPIDAGQAPADASRLSRSQEIERGLREGLSFVDLGVQFKRTPEFIFREAGRYLGPQRVVELSSRVKRGEWSEGERRWLESKGCLVEFLDVGEVATLLRRRERGVRKRMEKMMEKWGR